MLRIRTHYFIITVVVTLENCFIWLSLSVFYFISKQLQLFFRNYLSSLTKNVQLLVLSRLLMLAIDNFRRHLTLVALKMGRTKKIGREYEDETYYGSHPKRENVSWCCLSFRFDNYRHDYRFKLWMEFDQKPRPSFTSSRLQFWQCFNAETNMNMTLTCN